MTSEENKTDVFVIGIYAMEAIVIIAIIYAMVVLPSLLKPVI
jgi:hypothetical protein